METPFVSIIIPCRNEENFIGKCLDSIIENDYPKNKLEILIVDGMSEDNTRNIVKQYVEKYSFINIFDNKRKIVPVALNIGIQHARGEIIMRMDAHVIYERNYISQCVKYLKAYNSANVGGICYTMPGKNTILGKAIAFALAHPFGVGNSYFRIGIKKPKFVDTVPFGCFKREIFEKIGFFDEDLIRNQDDEFSMRIIKSGGKILLVPDIVSYYYARDSLSKLWKMYFQYGYFKPLVARKIGVILTWRQLIPSAFVGSLIFFSILSFFSKIFLFIFFSILFSYITVNMIFSSVLAIKKGLKYLLFLPIVFATFHFSYGFGYLKGIFDFIFFKREKRKKIVDVPLTR
ncbi:MAG: glycosyltransferase family 2 protein [Thermoplasmata archaeon]